MSTIITYTTHTARKRHHCTPYEHRYCLGSGWIEKGEPYSSPEGDCIDPFHPYRLCKSCVINGEATR